MISKFYFNEELHDWQRVDRVQEYRGIKIETITRHPDYSDPINIHNTREYRITYPDGRTAYYPINKRGYNITALKKYIDFKIEHS